MEGRKAGCPGNTGLLESRRRTKREGKEKEKEKEVEGGFVIVWDLGANHARMLSWFWKGRGRHINLGGCTYLVHHFNILMT